jgi:prevent-host-death family protein
MKMPRAARPATDRRKSHPPTQPWRLEQAKARFSELVRLARKAGPQRVTLHGQDAVVVLSAEDFARLSPAAAAPSLAALFGTGPFARLDGFTKETVRERSPVRDATEF